jgi:DUF2933 family protein
MDDDRHNSPRRGFFASPANIVLVGFLAIAGFYLVTEHRAHLYGILPWLLLLACPFMHFFMHGGHGGHGGRETRDSDRLDDRSASPHQH